MGLEISLTQNRILLLGALDVWDQVILCCGGLSCAWCGLSIPDLYPLDAPNRDTQKCLQTYSDSP